MNTPSPSDIFNFPNGDIYIGKFTVNSSTFSIYRHGYGIYIKRNGIVFKGEWKNDILRNVDEIVFKDKSKFKSGHLYPSSFLNNNPIGPIEMTDLSGFKWQGHCNLDDATLTPVNNA